MERSSPSSPTASLEPNVNLEETREKAKMLIRNPGSLNEQELRDEIQTALRVTEVTKRFKALRFYDVLDEMVETGKDDLESLGTGLGYILKYAANVIRFPNRDEYKRIKVICTVPIN
jgi:hypothetical protein